METVLSVIIPCYNVEKTISRCLSSIERQKNDRVEIICVDDGSQDDTWNIVEKIPYVRAVGIGHGGVARARNVGLKMAKGKWVWFVDADDEIEENALSIVERNLDGDAVFFGATCLNYGEFSLPSIEPADRVVDDVFCTMLGEYKRPYVWNAVIKKDLLIQNDIFFPEALTIGEDMAFLIRTFRHAKRIVMRHETIYLYHYLENESLMKIVGTKEDALGHVFIVDTVFDGGILRGLNRRERKCLFNWAFDFMQESAKYADGVRAMGEVIRKNRITAPGKNYIKSIVLRSRSLTELWIAIKKKE